MKKAVTLYLEIEPYKKLQELVKPKKISVEINELIVKRIEETLHEDYVPEDVINYEDLKKEHSRLIKHASSLRSGLKKRGKYDSLSNFAAKKELHDNLDNLGQVVSEMISTWKGNLGDLHEFVSYLETIKQQWDVEARLKEIRLAAER